MVFHIDGMQCVGRTNIALFKSMVDPGKNLREAVFEEKTVHFRHFPNLGVGPSLYFGNFWI
jgi:hypothetical protein